MTGQPCALSIVDYYNYRLIVRIRIRVIITPGKYNSKGVKQLRRKYREEYDINVTVIIIIIVVLVSDGKGKGKGKRHVDLYSASS